jgi:hypothetical protein
MAKCEHGRLKSVCKDCKAAEKGGGSICDHDRVRQTCSVCSPEKVFAAYKHKAKQRNLSFALTLDEFEKIVQAACVFCGEQPALGVDRKDNRIGYIPWNCQAACGVCNFMKRAMLHHNFLFQVLKIAKHQESRKQKAA